MQALKADGDAPVLRAQAAAWALVAPVLVARGLQVRRDAGTLRLASGREGVLRGGHPIDAAREDGLDVPSWVDDGRQRAREAVAAELWRIIPDELLVELRDALGCWGQGS
jgi:L-asparaginase II